ncbi:tail fiber assembly protein [Aeromonas veronii]
MIIFRIESDYGCLLGDGRADENPLDHNSPLFPAYATTITPPDVGQRECARYLDDTGRAAAHHADGAWVIHPDWRDVTLWRTDDGTEITIVEPNVTPDEIGATAVPYPGQGYVWRDEQWQADPDLQYQLAEKAAERELASRQAIATSEINRIKPAVDGGYAKQEDVELLPKLQRYLYELPDVRTKPGWPENPQWLTEPEKVI